MAALIVGLLTSFLLLLTIKETRQSVSTNELDEEDSNPFMDLASAFLQNTQGGDKGGLGAIGNLVGSFMQGESGKQIGEMLLGQGKNNAASDVLSGIGSLLTNGEGKIDPSVVGTMINIFAQQASSGRADAARQPKKRDAEPVMDIGNILNFASTLLGQTDQNAEAKSPAENLMGLLPVLMNTVNSFTGPEAASRAHEHTDHAWFLPPVLENVHIFWDHFSNSELGRTLYHNSGVDRVMNMFTGKDGKINYEFLLDSLENLSFRRRWIKTATSFLTEWAVHIANPEVHSRYMESGRYLTNGFLKSQGFPKEALFDPSNSGESVTTALNYFMKRYFNMKTDVGIYVKPAVAYLTQILKLAQTQGAYLSRTDHNELSDRITDMLNLELIEPILRVYRVYRHARKSPHCQAHLMCLVNRHDPHEKTLGIPGFKQGLTRFGSLIASAAISYHGGHGFWDLYNAVQEDANCQAKYPADCTDFHHDENKVTTEYYHNEL